MLEAPAGVDGFRGRTGLPPSDYWTLNAPQRSRGGGMTCIVDKLIAAHSDQGFVFATTKREIVAALDKIRNIVGEMEDFAEFPEGANGAVLYALLKNASTSCPDAGEFNHVHQGCQAALTTAFEVLREEINWSPGLNRRID